MSKCNCVGDYLCLRVCLCVCVCQIRFSIFIFRFAAPASAGVCVSLFSLHASNCHKIIAYSRASALMALREVVGGVGLDSEIDFVRGKQTIDFGTHLRPAPPMADSWRRRSCTRDSDLSDRPPPDYCRRVQLILRHGHRCAPVQQQRQ